MTTHEHPTAATMYCLGCGYCLDGLTESRCPECGRRFEPSDSTSFAYARTESRKKLSGRLCFACAAAGTILLAIELRSPPYISYILLSALTFEVVAVIIGLVGLARRNQSKRHIGFGFGFVAAFVVAVILLGVFLIQMLGRNPRGGWFL